MKYLKILVLAGIFFLQSICAAQSVLYTGATLSDNGAYVLLWNQNDAWWSGIPKSLSDKITELHNQGKVLKSVALRDDGGCVILWGQNEAFWSGIPQSLSDKILELNKEGKVLKSVALRDDGGYVILWGQNDAWWSGIPKSLSDKILELNKQGKVLKSVALRDDGGYVLLWGQNDAWWWGIPKSLSDKILELNKQGSVINSVALQNNGGYLLLWGQNGAWWSGIPQSLSNKIVTLSGQVVENIDNKAPEITIYQPYVSNGNTITETNKQILIRGRATDNTGIDKLTINGFDTYTDLDGNFQRQIELYNGNNTITISATDAKNNAASYTFYVNKTEPANNNVVINNNYQNINEKRLALVIGNSNYGAGQTLKNPANDADLMATTLQNLGFEVIKQIDANKQSMEQAIRAFSKKLSDCNVALFYYAGHGVQVDGLNYLIPTDARLNDKSDCKFEAVSINFVVEEFEKYPDNVNVVILDACRNNPFRSWTRGGERGFKAISPTSGTIISFATSEGSTASDGIGKNGLFTEQLVKQMYVPQPIESVFKKTRVEVENKSNGAQSPQEWSKLKGDFYFKK